MRSFVLLACFAAVISAQGPGDDVPYNCAKPNSQYCLAGDIILRCNESAIGFPGRCSANLSGYPPAGGIASCWQSGEEAGDAACVKNCVVHAEEFFTLPADECTPSFTSSMPWNTTLTTKTTVITDPLPSTETSSDVVTTETGIPTDSGVITDTLLPTGTGIISNSSPATETGVITDPIRPTGTGPIVDPIWPPIDSSYTMSIPVITDDPSITPVPLPSPLPTTSVPVSSPLPTTSAPTGAAVANQATGVLAAVALAIAYIL